MESILMRNCTISLDRKTMQPIKTVCHDSKPYSVPMDYLLKGFSLDDMEKLYQALEAKRLEENKAING